MHSVTTQTRSQEGIDVLDSDDTHVEGVLDLEDAPVLAGFEICGSLGLLEVVAGDYQEKVDPESHEELDGPQPHVAGEVTEKELRQ